MEPVAAWGVAILQAVQYEMLLVAAVGIMILGVEDFTFDVLWLLRKRTARAAGDGALVDGTIAIFVPAWHEQAVLPATLRGMLARWQAEDIRIYVGCYPNDGLTQGAISALVAAEPRLRLVVADHPGPTSKADNLNQMWRAVGIDERASASRIVAVVLHDAEDQVCVGEIALFRRHLAGAMLVQIPVEPLLPSGGGLIAGHYADEFAEAHAKEMPLRAAMGTALPAAGVGCAFSRAALTILALGREDGPFQADSLTEDYEAGLILGASGGTCRFIDECDSTGSRIATRGIFPANIPGAVQQKGRWIAGIALAAWHRLDWRGNRLGGVDREQPLTISRRLLTGWMLWRDRRALLSALIMLCAYAALTLTAIDLAGQWAGCWSPQPLTSAMFVLLTANGLILLWRLAMRAMFAGSIYGWRQGLLSIPRSFVGNIIHIMAAWRAIGVYLRQIFSGRIVWDKTVHDAAPHSADDDLQGAAR